MHSLGPRVHIASFFRAREDDVNCESLGAGQNGEWYSDPKFSREPCTDRDLLSALFKSSLAGTQGRLLQTADGMCFVCATPSHVDSA